MKNKNIFIKIGLMILLILVNASFIIKPIKAESLSGPTSVIFGDDVNLQWYVKYAEFRNEYAFSIPFSQIYSRLEYESNWKLEGIIGGRGWKNFQMPLEHHGEWDFKVEIWVRSGHNHNSYAALMETELIYDLQCLFPLDINIDLKIMYDTSALQSLNNDFDISSGDLHSRVEYGLDTFYQVNFGNEIDFFTSDDPDWTIHDTAGDGILSWFTGGNRLPSGQGNGYYFENLIYFEYDPDSTVLGRHWSDGVITINLAKHEYFSGYTHEQFYTVFSTLMHEVGHSFGINGVGKSSDLEGDNPETGDTTKKRYSVMDYHWARYGYGYTFDQGHRDTIIIDLMNRISF